MAFKMGGSAQPNSDINVTPLIDVVLVLLIIFMVITPRVVHEISANLPSKNQPVKKPKEKSRGPGLAESQICAQTKGSILALYLEVSQV